MYYLTGIILGLLPEVLYFTLFLIYTKNLKEKRIKLFLLMSVIYILCIMINQYKTIYYISFIVLVYCILKLLYRQKTQIIDIFVFSLSMIYLTLLATFSLMLFTDDLSNYYILYIIARILLFIPFIFKSRFNVLYQKYCKLWNRNDKEKRPIKSITLRNISLIIINVTIFIINIATLSIINFLK